MSETPLPPEQDIDHIKLQLEHTLQFDEAGEPIPLEQGIDNVRFNAANDEQQFRNTTLVLGEVPTNYPYREALQASIDAQPNVLSTPYPPGQAEKPYKDDADFEDLVVSAVNIASDVSNPYRENALANIREKLHAALREDPSRIGAVRKIAGQLGANADKATASMDNSAGNLAADREYAAATNEYRRRDLQAPAEIDESKHKIFGIPKYRFTIDAPHDTFGVGLGSNRLQIPRPRIHKTIDLAKQDQATAKLEVANRGFVHNEAVTTAADSKRVFEQKVGFATEDKNKVLALEWVMSSVGFNPNGPSAEDIENEFGSIDTHAQFLAEDLSKWRSSESIYEFDTEEEFHTFGDLTALSTIIKQVDSDLRGRAPFGPDYNKLVAMRADATKLYISGRYRQAQIGIERSLVANEGFRGRFGSHYHPDKGIEIEDGWGVVIYPDGSYAQATGPGTSQNRRNSDGSVWTKPQESPIANTQPAEAPDLAHASYEDYLKAQNEWFIHQDKQTATNLQKQAERISKWSLEVADDDPSNTAARRSGNIAAYWSGFLRNERISNKGPVVEPNGTVTYREAHFYGRSGSWTVGPNGSMELFVIDKINGRGNKKVLASYSPEGIEL
jgi:hypothetical protein